MKSIILGLIFCIKIYLRPILFPTLKGKQECFVSDKKVTDLGPVYLNFKKKILCNFKIIFMTTN
jgi:hypothetical protein